MPNDAKSGAELLGILLEQHRFYINRNWQYFGAILLIDSLVLNAYRDLRNADSLVATISSTSVVLVAIFYHLINWTDMRVDRNAERIKLLPYGEIIERRQGLLEGLILWMKLGIVMAAVPHLFLSMQLNSWLVAGEAGILVLFIATSEILVRKARKRRIGELGTKTA
jgi:hypothetical protein